MKKGIITTIIIIILGFIAYQAYVFTSTNEDNINPIYLIPKDAVFIIDTERPIDTWDEISHSTIWKHLQQNSYFRGVTESLHNLDQTFKEQQQLIQFLGERNLLISVHVYKPKKYGLFYTVDLQKLSKLEFLKNNISKLAGNNFNVTKRKYHNHEITELYDRKKRETLYISFIKNQLIASYTHILVENAIDQYAVPIIGRDLNFIEINQEVTRDGFFKLFIQYKYLKNYLSCFSNKINLKPLNVIQNSWLYSGFDVGLKESVLIQAEGHTNFKPSSDSYLQALQKSGKGERTIANIAPKNTALYLSFAFDSFKDFHDNFEALNEENQESFEAYTKQVTEIEDQLDINLKKHVFSWIGNEIAILHINDAISKKQKDVAAVLKTNDIDKAKENLNFLLSQIKEKTPLKFKQINYKNYVINFLDLKGFFKILAGNLFEKMEKPYFTIIDDCVIFSNSPNTLKEIINTKIANFTLSSSKNYTSFNDQFNQKSSMFLYINTPYIYEDLLSFTDRKTRNELTKNKDYFISFSQIGLQLTSDGGQFKSYLALFHEDPKLVNKQLLADKQLQKELTKIKGTSETTAEENIFTLSEIFPTDLSASSFKKYYDTGELKFEVELKDGRKHGDYTSYYKNGKVKVNGKFKKGKQVGIWRAYSKEDGKLFSKKDF
ncbi:DUF3352 domain-containing protein [Tenacibaculum maritimum]|uniref:DUF3352 domain-containing protein n=1 Tax=Tenacibaculum maritimum TaxID=107401 RepID=UPI000408C23F|nr:DUF3352 domain-containing protein [Tenacibaculum maritimum]